MMAQRLSTVVVAIENTPSSQPLGFAICPCWIDSLSELQDLPHLVLDATHLGTLGFDPLAVYDKLRGQVPHVHLCNCDGWEHGSPPDRRLPLPDLLRSIAEDG